jgi:hypothetical protein
MHGLNVNSEIYKWQWLEGFGAYFSGQAPDLHFLFSIDPLVFTDYPLRLKFCVSGQIGQTLPSMV